LQFYALNDLRMQALGLIITVSWIKQKLKSITANDHTEKQPKTSDKEKFTCILKTNQVDTGKDQRVR